MSTWSGPDRRRAAYRDDLADEALRGVVEAPRFVLGERMQVGSRSAAVRRLPRADAGLDTEALKGEIVTVFDQAEGWAWVQLERDHYVGYLPSQALSPTILTPTHRVTALRTFVYPAPDMKVPPIDWLSLNAVVTAGEKRGRFVEIGDGGFVFLEHLRPANVTARDFVAIASRFQGTPYLWGGRTSLGLDCSGLIQLALEAAGVVCPRDTDMQQAELGKPVDDLGPRKRGDLVFWKGHVGVMLDPDRLLHANAHHMLTMIEPLKTARDRIAAHGTVTAVRRLG